MAERAKLFVALLKRRAQRALEAHRAPPPPLVRFSAGVSEGYESNVNLDGEKRGDFFTEEHFRVTLRPRVTSWLRGRFTYSLRNTHYQELRDSNLWSNALGATAQLQPHKRVRLDLGYEYRLINFPFNTSNSVFEHRPSVHLLLAQTSWLTHKFGWTYQLRDYDTRKARDPDGVGILGVTREDQRHTGSYEMRLRFPKTSVRLGGRFYRNFSNELFRNFYNWEDYRLRGVLSRELHPDWTGTIASTYERRNYQQRRVPSIHVAERDNLYTFAGSLTYRLNEQARLTYALTYRYQDSNDPRQDFVDWINHAGLRLRF